MKSKLILLLTGIIFSQNIFAQLSEQPLNNYLRSEKGNAELSTLTNNAPETFNRVKLLDLGKNSLPVRQNLIKNAQRFIFITAPYWDNDPIGRGIVEAANLRKQEIQDLDFRVIMGWSTPLFSKEGKKIVKKIRDNDNLMLWNAPWWQRNFSYNIGGHEVHDKMFIVDGDKMVMGGMNMTQDYLEGGAKEYGWHDTDIFIEGPAAQVATDIYLKIFTLGKYLASSAHFSPFNPKKNGVLQEGSEIKALHGYFYNNKEDHDFTTMHSSGQELMPGDYLTGPGNMQVVNRVHISILPLLNSLKYHPIIETDNSFNVSVRLLYDNPLIDRRIDTKENEHYSKTRNTIEYLLSHAENNAWFFMPYLSIDKTFFDILTKEAKRINIRIITNSVDSNDMGSKSYKTAAAHYLDLMKAGIEIYEFVGNNALKSLTETNNCQIAESNWPGKTLHSKVALFDGAVAMIGSNNMNYRSFNKNNELMALINDVNFAQGVKKLFDRQFDSLNATQNVECLNNVTGEALNLIKPPSLRRVTYEFFEEMKAKYKIEDKQNFTPSLSQQ